MTTMATKKAKTSPKIPQAMPPLPKTAAPVEPTLFDDIQTADLSASEKLADSCVAVNLYVSRVSSRRTVDTKTKAKMADTVNAEAAALSASKQLYDSRHEAIKNVNKVLAQAEGILNSMAVPMAAPRSAPGQKARMGFVPQRKGWRAMRIEQYPEFNQRMKALLPEIAAAEQLVNDHLPDIKALARERLGDAYREEDYPERVSITVTWGVTSLAMPKAVDVWPTELLDEVRSQKVQELEDTVALATASVLEEFLAVVGAWVDRLGPVQRIYPASDSKYAKYHGCEILEVVTAADNADVPEGRRRLLLAYYPERSRKREEIWTEALDDAGYAMLHVSAVGNEAKGFKSSTIEGMNEFLLHFRHVADTIGAGDDLRTLVQDVERQIGQLPTTEALTKELKNSATFRTQTHQVMAKLQGQLTQHLESVRVASSRYRAVDTD